MQLRSFILLYFLSILARRPPPIIYFINLSPSPHSPELDKIMIGLGFTGAFMKKLSRKAPEGSDSRPKTNRYRYVRYFKGHIGHTTRLQDPLAIQ